MVKNSNSKTPETYKGNRQTVKATFHSCPKCSFAIARRRFSEVVDSLWHVMHFFFGEHFIFQISLFLEKFASTSPKGKRFQP